MKKLLLLVVLFSSFTLEAQNLFEYVPEAKAYAKSPALPEGVLSERRIDLDSDVLRYSSFVFPAGDGYEMAYRSENIEERTSGFVSRFRVGTSEAVSTVTHRLGYTSGIIYVEDRVFEIRPDGDGHILLEYSSMSFECGAEYVVSTGSVLTAPATFRASSGRPRPVVREPRPPSSFEIDLAEGYMGTAATAVGGRLQIEAMIQNGVDTLNTVVRNSGITNVRFNLKGIREFQFDDTTGITTSADILARLVSNQEFNAWRDSLGADLAGMWINRRAAAAYIPYGTSFGRATSYHYVGATMTSSPIGLTYSHETGHNLGMEHDRANANVNDPNATNYGWYDCMAGWATIMSYQNQVCRDLNVAEPIRIPYFSNPQVKYNGVATGIEKANNAGRLKFSAPYVSAYVSPRN